MNSIKTFEFTKIIGIENIEFGNNVIIDDFVLIYAKSKVKIGNYVHIANFSSITAVDEFCMGDFSAVSQGCRILTATDDFIYKGFGNSTINDKYRNIKKDKVTIGKFSIIGANSVVLPGVKIGDGAVVGANSVVTKNLDDWGVYIGNKRIKDRNKEAVLENYERFLKDNEIERVGNLFK